MLIQNYSVLLSEAKNREWQMQDKHCHMVIFAFAINTKSAK